MAIDLNAQIHQYLSSAPSSLFAQQEVEMIDHWQGDANLLWKVRVQDQDAVIKLFLDAGQARSRRQFEGHQLFAPLGLAPKPLWVDRYPHGLSRQLIVYRWVEGDTISGEEPHTLETWAQAVAKLHRTPASEVSRFSPHPINLDFYWRIEQASIRQISAWLAASGLSLSAIFNHLAAVTEEVVQRNLPLWSRAMPAAIHGDLALRHTLYARGQICMLDWEMFGLGDPALDVARLLQREAQTLGEDQVDTWLATYLQYVDQPTLSERIELFRDLLEVHNVIYLLDGLHQHCTRQVGGDLSTLLSFLQSALTTAIERAAVKMELPAASTPAVAVAEFIRWVGEATTLPS